MSGVLTCCNFSTELQGQPQPQMRKWKSKDNSFKCESMTFKEMKQSKCNSDLLLFVESAFVSAS